MEAWLIIYQCEQSCIFSSDKMLDNHIPQLSISPYVSHGATTVLIDALREYIGVIRTILAWTTERLIRFIYSITDSLGAQRFGVGFVIFPTCISRYQLVVSHSSCSSAEQALSKGFTHAPCLGQTGLSSEKICKKKNVSLREKATCLQKRKG